MEIKENLKIENIQHPEWGIFRVLNKYDKGILVHRWFWKVDLTQ